MTLVRRKCWRCLVVKNCVQVDDHEFIFPPCSEELQRKFPLKASVPKVGRTSQERTKP